MAIDREKFNIFIHNGMDLNLARILADPDHPMNPAAGVTGSGGGPSVSSSFKGEWIAQAYSTNDLVTRNKALYVATKDSTPDDDPAFVGAPVDVGGLGSGTANPCAGGQRIGTTGNVWTKFTLSGGTSVAQVQLWAAPSQTVTGPLTAGIYSADRSTMLGSGTLSGTLTGSLIVTMTDPINLAAGDYNVWYTNGDWVGVAFSGALTPDGLVSAVPEPGASFSTDFGTTDAVTPFRLWAPPASDSAWVRLVKGV